MPKAEVQLQEAFLVAMKVLTNSSAQGTPGPEMTNKQKKMIFFKDYMPLRMLKNSARKGKVTYTQLLLIPYGPKIKN